MSQVFTYGNRNLDVPADFSTVQLTRREGQPFAIDTIGLTAAGARNIHRVRPVLFA